MLPDNEALRRRHAPLAEFVAGACRAPLRFPPGSDTRYQSMGFLLAAEIAARATRTSFAEHLRTAVLEPLGMRATSLGLGARRLEETIPCQVPDEDWGWNSRYWRSLGAPWGGAIGTAPDLLRLLRFFAHPGRGPLGPEAAQAMLTAQIAGGRPHEYGLGWRLGPFAKGGTPQTFGHGGATGCVAWFDRGKDLGCVVLTSLPEAAGKTTVLGPVSAAVLAAF
jgi:CubicO group peptidase (beta-lactamase class C family)